MLCVTEMRAIQLSVQSFPEEKRFQTGRSSFQISGSSFQTGRSPIQTGGSSVFGLRFWVFVFDISVNSVVRQATIFVFRIHFTRRTSLEVEVIQRTLVTAKDLGIFLLKWVGKDGRLPSLDHNCTIVLLMTSLLSGVGPKVPSWNFLTLSTAKLIESNLPIVLAKEAFLFWIYFSIEIPLRTCCNFPPFKSLSTNIFTYPSSRFTLLAIRKPSSKGNL